MKKSVKLPKMVYVLLGVVILAIVLLVFVKDDTKSETSNNSAGTASSEVGTYDINEQIKKDNEALGVTGEAIDSSSESTSTSVSESQTSNEENEKLIASLDHGTDDISSVEDFCKDMTAEDFDYSEYDYTVCDSQSKGTGATMDAVLKVMTPENETKGMTFADAVAVKHLDDMTTVYKLSENCDDLIVYHCCRDDEANPGYDCVEPGQVKYLFVVVKNLSVQKYNGKDVLVAMYE